MFSSAKTRPAASTEASAGACGLRPGRLKLALTRAAVLPMRSAGRLLRPARGAGSAAATAWRASRCARATGAVRPDAVAGLAKADRAWAGADRADSGTGTCGSSEAGTPSISGRRRPSATEGAGESGTLLLRREPTSAGTTGKPATPPGAWATVCARTEDDCQPGLDTRTSTASDAATDFFVRFKCEDCSRRLAAFAGPRGARTAR